MKHKVIFTSLSLVLIVACDFYDTRLIINNRSSKNIYVAIIQDTILGLGENKTFMMSPKYFKINERKNLIKPGKKGWESLAEHSINKQLHIFILPEDTLKKYDPQEIVERQLFEKRVDIGIPELKAHNWEILISGRN